MRFLLYNIRYGAGIGPRFHLPVPYSGYLKRTTGNMENIVEFIKGLRPDVVGLVEVDSGSYRTAKACQAENIASEIGHFHLVQSKYDQRSIARRMPVLGTQGNAVLAREEIVGHRFHYFSAGVKRLVIEAQLPQVTIFLVHLSLTYRKRQTQLGELFKFISTVQGPKIVAGDFNVLWGDQELGLFMAAAGLRSANGQGQPSHPSREPTRQLDYILHSPELEVNDFFVPTVRYSDHAPLVCDLELRD